MIDKQKALTEIGLRIRQLREAKELSLQEFADKLDIEYNNVIRIEKDRTNFTIPHIFPPHAKNLSNRRL